MKLHELLERVDSKATFFAFIQALKEDKLDEERKEELIPSDSYSNGANGWSNGSITQFLDAIYSYGIAHDDIHLNWKDIAQLFYAGKMYE